MTEDQAFLQAILEAHDDDAPRLVYADWLDDLGDNWRAAVLRRAQRDAHGYLWAMANRGYFAISSAFFSMVTRLWRTELSVTTGEGAHLTVSENPVQHGHVHQVGTGGRHAAGAGRQSVDHHAGVCMFKTE